MVHKKFEALKKERAQLRTSFTNTKKAIEVLLQETESRHKCEKLEAHVQLLDLRIESISNKDAQIAELLYDSEADFSQDVLEEEQCKVDHYQLEFLTVKKLVESHLAKVSEVGSEVLSNHACAQAQQFKLPVLQLKKFDGTLKDWLPFWSQFSKIDQDQSMSDIDKMGYLCMSMIPGSPADKLVQSYPATGKMYESVIAALKARFGRDDLLTEYYIRQLLKIVIGNAKTKQPLTTLYDTLQCHLRNLETLNVSSENCAPILMPLVSSCLPDDILQIWERSCVTQFAASTSKDECDGSSKDHLQSLMNFLKAEVESEQKIAMAKDGFGLHSSSSQNVSRPKPSKPMSGNSKIATAADLVVTQGPWLEELQRKSIPLTDLQYPTTDIEILIGADVAGRLYTGEVIELESKLVAMNTRLGWTLSGKVPGKKGEKGIAMTVTSLFVKEASVSDLWALDVLGICDPTHKMLQADLDKATEEHFLSSVIVNKESRFEVRLPFVDGHPPLSVNLGLAEKRLQSTIKRLKSGNLETEYQKVLTGWELEGIIERVPIQDSENPSYYLPHHPVVKVGSTTPVRPVFDASAKEPNKCSLNQCLEKGPNLIDKIPSCLARFRRNMIGVSGDIAKAFLQITVSEADRDYLRFLWLENGQVVQFRHCRVVFGVSSSPFLLEACIRLLLNSTQNPHPFVAQLKQSFYVDNCITSLKSVAEAREFIEVASDVMRERQFDLRGWEITGDPETEKPTNLLGLLWNKVEDTLSVSIESLKEMQYQKVTKKILLSAAHRLFDPIGFVSCVALIPKLLVQQTWQQSLSWNDEVHEDIWIAFQRWMTEIDLLTEVNIPRWIADVEGGSRELHVFADACKSAYAAVVFLRIEHKQNIQVRLLACKARVAPTSKSSKPMTIPRLELLAALIAARLCQMVVKDYELDGVKTTFWTDASTVLAWLERNDPWDVYVHNRVVEIKQLSEGCTWKHVPGEMNPADLPSRGCYPKKFVKSRWWEGPTWLKSNPEDWPQVVSEFDEEEINMERKKTVVSSMLNTENHDQSWCKYFSNYTKLVRMVAWMRRFKINAMIKKNTGSLPEPQDLTVQEFMSAERVVFRLVQKESPTEMKKMECVQTVIEDDLVRLVTKTSYRNDDENFCYPVVLPASHPVVQRLVLSTHRENCHAGSQTLLAILRQQFWLIGGRRAVRKILKDCVVCKRYTQHKVQTKAIPLPEPRVRDARTFEVTGVDLAGPLFVRTNTNEIRKVWICIFACAVYRAVRLELVWSLSTDSFIQALRRFISRQGRPEIVYSDCGTNFVGFDHASSKIDWNEVSRYSSTKKIEWRFNPPSGPWWGGFYERLIGMMKQLLKRVLGKSRVTCEELLTMLSDCEAVMNSRPLSYMSEDKSETSFLTPAMFLQDIIENGVPEYDLIQDTDLGKRFKYRQELVQELRKKFRDEYLGQLQPLSVKRVDKPLQVGEIVLIGDDNIKRVNWPTGIITEIVEGKDGHARVVKLRTAEGTLTRPVQRIFRLELLSEPRPAKTCDPMSGEMEQLEPSPISSVPVTANSESPKEPSSIQMAPVRDNPDGSGQFNPAPNIVSYEPKLPTMSRSGRKIKGPIKLDL
ncbi:hypothetical protein M8J77_009660 [Diaphorina citri]|nr:hypothetical protein M8J77_009660 [Diaphorina citri]